MDSLRGPADPGAVGFTEAFVAQTSGPNSSRYLFFEGCDREVPVRTRRQPGFQPATVPDDASPEVRFFFARLFAIAGLDAGHYRDRALTRRLPACLRFLGVKTVAEASALISARPALAGKGLSTVLLGVTEFFRDPGVFRFLESNLLPGLLADVARPRIWSAACSDGRELYSVAMLVARQGQLQRCEFLGTDCRAEAIVRARQGLYEGADKLGDSGGPGFRRDEPPLCHMPAALRAAVAWKQADVLAGAEPGPWHLILCRNLSIYLRPAAAGRLWAAFAHELAPGGHLVVGKADYPSRDLPLRRISSGVYRKVLS